MANPATQDDDDIRVVIDGDGDSVHTLPDGSIAIDQPDGGVVIRMNPQRAADPDVDDPSKFYANIVDKLGESELLTLANELYEAVDADDKSRANWLANQSSGLELLGLSLQDPSVGDGASAVDGQSVVTNPLLLEAVLKGWANAQAELLPAEGPCKVTNQADKASQAQDDLGEAFQRDMNYFLTSIATEFAPETSHMLLWGTYFGGSGFKKVYTHPLKKRPASESVEPRHLIVSDATKDFAACERITHQITMRQSVMKRYQAKGIYRDIALAPPTPAPNPVDEQIASQQGVALRKDRPEDQPYTLWEIQCELDLDQFAPRQFKGKGVPLPYLVTMDKDSQVILAMRRDWKPEDEDCTRKRMYVKYPYVPGPGFYGTGLLNILGNASAAMTAAWRLGLDTAMYANFPAFLLDKLAGRQNTSDFRLSPGTGTLVETGGRPLADVVQGLPYKDVTAGLMSLMDKITQQAKETGGSPDIPVGEGTADIPVGTMLAHIEQATKVMAAAHKGQHRAMDEELTLIADLFRENPESFWKGNKDAQGYWTVERLIEALNTRTLVPKSDPNVPSHIHRVMKAVALVELAGSPLGVRLDKDEVLRRVLSAMREDSAGLILPPAPTQGPSPEEITAQAKLLEAQNKGKSIENDTAELAQKPALQEQETQGEIKGKTIDLAKALVTHTADRQDAAHSQKMDIAEHARNVNKDALDATKTTADVLKTHHDMAMDRAGQQLEGDQQAHQQGIDQGDQALSQQKVGIDGAKLGIAQQQADTQTHTALNPPKPAAAAAKKPKKKK